MKILILLFCTVVVAFCKKQKCHPLSQDFIDIINTMNTTWKAGRNFHRNASLVHIKHLLGVHPNAHQHKLPIIEMGLQAEEDIPENFDSRSEWADCPTISEIRDQGSCGSCWAFAATEAMSDRICIHSKGEDNARLSAQDLLSCCIACGFGCNGGYPGAAWRYFVHKGIVTGGPYGSDQGCVPYEIPPCEHHNDGPRPPCDDKTPITPRCDRTCQQSYKHKYKEDLFFGKTAYGVSEKVAAIQTEVMTNGPVEAAMVVFEDFLSYKSGVYKHVIGEGLGGHAVRLLGWGEENDVDYWLMANSWNTDWGDNGYFKILRGHDECGIESSISAGIPHSPSENRRRRRPF